MVSITLIEILNDKKVNLLEIILKIIFFLDMSRING